MRALLSDLRGRLEEMLGLLERFVTAESPSGDKQAIDKFGEIVSDEWRKRGARVERLAQRESGDHVFVELPLENATGTRGRVLLLGHLDTVYDIGTLSTMPFRVASGRAYGPGIFDMKGGLVLALAAFDAMRRVGAAPRKAIACLWNSDEEIGSFSSREAIEREARRSDAVLVLEPAA